MSSKVLVHNNCKSFGAMNEIKKQEEKKEKKKKKKERGKKKKKNTCSFITHIYFLQTIWGPVGGANLLKPLITAKYPL
jgi:hypothetical protein